MSEIEGSAPNLRPSTQPKRQMRVTDGELKSTRITLDQLAAQLEPYSDRPIVNATKLTGVYDAAMRVDEAAMRVDEADHTSIVTAVREQLGLQLRPEDRPMKVVVVDSATRLGK
jgi:uncharacterized protein (TIGR03435 family)